MNRDRWKEINSIVDDVLLEQEPGIRRAIIENRCGSDDELRKEVLQLLSSIDESADYWETLFRSNKIFINELAEDYPKGNGSKKKRVDIPAPDEENFPKSIGNYAIHKRIGYGGMGEVFLASRIDEKFHQNVALKLIRQHVTSKEQARRFEQERVILSTLNHPNISRLLDGGISQDGRSYYVMEYVDGLPITDFCLNHDCSLEERLELFEQVCSAVQYAHSNFIVHRDLKPENLLVDENGTVKVLDFGIAKMIGDSLDEQALLQTMDGLRMLSLKYASPEQVTLEPITTATDVYALGVLLYEMTTGTHPLPLENKRLTEAEQIIRGYDPPKPSIATPSQSGKLKGDLDAIILKAMRKEPSERYGTAKSMMEDIDRYRQSMPVSARQDSIPYLLKKFLRRHSISLLFTGVLTALIIGFAFFYTHRISQEKQQAQLQAQKAEQVTQFLIQLFEANNPEQSVGQTMNVEELLLRGEEEALRLEGQPELKAQMFEVIGEIYRLQGRYTKSEELLQSSFEIRESIYSVNHDETVSVMDKLGILLIQMGEYDQADSILTRTLQIHEEILESNGPELAETLSKMAYLIRRRGDLQQSEELYRRSLAIREEHLGDDHPLTLENMSSLGVILHNSARYRETEQLYRELLKRRMNLFNPIHPDIAVSQNSLGALLMNMGNFAEADSLLRKALEVREKLYGEEHPDVALTLNNLAICMMETRRLAEAAQFANRAYEIRSNLLGENNVNTAITKFTLADLMLKTGEADSSLSLYRDAYKQFRKTLGDRHSFTARAFMGIGSVHLAMDQVDAAHSFLQSGFSVVKQIHPEQSLEYALASIRLAEYHLAVDENSRSRELLNTALEALQNIETEESVRQEEVLAMLRQTRP
jgi:serine/threonine-protein kinase